MFYVTQNTHCFLIKKIEDTCLSVIPKLYYLQKFGKYIIILARLVIDTCTQIPELESSNQSAD